MKRNLFFILILLILSATSMGDHLIVRRNATIKEQPDRNAQILTRVEPDTPLTLLDDGAQENGYYHVTLPNSSGNGWIYRTLVRRRPGAIDTSSPGHESTIPGHLQIGKPLGFYERIRTGYALSHDNRLKIPVWVQYRLRKEDLTSAVERTDDFRPDTSIPRGSRAELRDYAGSGYDRGHMASAKDMARNEEVMSESFLLSNMAPQVGVGFNRQIWKTLESDTRKWTQKRDALTVIVGPVFIADDNKISYKVIGDNQVAVPTHFYKIIVDANDADNVEALAFLMPNENLSGHTYEEYLVSIDRIEKLTGLDFLSALSQGTQELVETDPAEELWEK